MYFVFQSFLCFISQFLANCFIFLLSITIIPNLWSKKKSETPQNIAPFSSTNYEYFQSKHVSIVTGSKVWIVLTEKFIVLIYFFFFFLLSVFELTSIETKTAFPLLLMATGNRLGFCGHKLHMLVQQPFRPHCSFHLAMWRLLAADWSKEGRAQQRLMSSLYKPWLQLNP